MVANTGVPGTVTRATREGSPCSPWGYPLDYTVAVDELITISEVNPDGEAVFQMNMSGDGYPVSSYRVYRMPETEFKIPWNLP